jgi:hypothetical protein
VAVLLIGGSAGARADGCKFASDGRLVPERQQRALVEWADGTETLYIAALSDPTAGGSVWVVPVRAAAAAVRAEPVEEFPAVAYYETLRGRAERQLQNTIAIAAVFDSGFLCCPLVVGGCAGETAPKSAAEVSRVEKLGMVVTVVSAESRDELERYLDAQGVNRAAADLSSLGPYFGDGRFAFVCGWVSKRDTPATATGVKVVFPSPTLWFPLRPTRAYTNPVEAMVFARGFVKPAAGCELPGLTCEYVYGAVEAMSVRQAFGKDRPRDLFHYHHSGRLERLTRVTLTADPQAWDRDLELVPGTTPVGSVAVLVTGWAGDLALPLSALLGAALGLMIPRVAIPRAEVRLGDWLAGALTGAAIALTIWVSLLVFNIWRWWPRTSGWPDRPRVYAVLPALAVAHFGITWAVCRGLMAWIATG